MEFTHPRGLTYDQLAKLVQKDADAVSVYNLFEYYQLVGELQRRRNFVEVSLRIQAMTGGVVLDGGPIPMDAIS